MGAGLKTFGSEPLSSADVNGYLMRQAVIACTSTTRPSAPETGMTIFETDTGKHRFWSGTGWRHLGKRRVVSGGTATSANGFAGTANWIDTGISVSITTATEQVDVMIGLVGDVGKTATGAGGFTFGISLDSGGVFDTGWWMFDEGATPNRLNAPLYLGDTVIPAAGQHTIRLWRRSPGSGGNYGVNNVGFRCLVAD